MNETDRSIEELARLEAAAMAGEPVTPAELSAARERVTLSELAARGAALRADARRSVKAGETREAAKLEAALVFRAHDDDTMKAYAQAVSAMEALIEAIEAGDARIDQAELILRRAGVAARGWDGASADELDPQNYASMQQGGTASVVTLEGKAHTRESAALWLAAAVHAVARAHEGLQLPGGRGPLERRVEFDKPRALSVVYDDQSRDE